MTNVNQVEQNANNLYTSRDTQEIINRIIQNIQSETNKLTDFSDASINSTFIDVLAGVSDYLHYYLDNQAYESFLTTARQPNNIRANAESLGHKLERVGSAEGEVEITINNIAGDTESGNTQFQGYIPPVKIPAYTEIYTSEEPHVQYVTLDPIVFTTQQKQSVRVRQGILKQVEVTSKYLKQEYKYYLSNTKLIPFNSVNITIENKQWERVEDAFIEIAGGKKFLVHTDSDGGTYILFTWDWKEQLPEADTGKVKISYLESIGTKGTVLAGTLNAIKGPVYDGQGTDISKSIFVTNNQPTSGAFDEISPMLLKAQALANLKRMDRNITIEDYRAACLNLTQFVKSMAHDWHTAPEIVTEPYYIQAWLVPQDLNIEQLPETTINYDDIAKDLQSKGVTYQKVFAQSADYVKIPLLVQFSMRGSGEYRDSLRQKVQETLEEVFNIKNCEFGYYKPNIYEDEIDKVIHKISNDIKLTFIYRLLLDENTGNSEKSNFSKIEIAPTQFPIFIFDVELIGDDTGAVDDTDN